LRERRGSAVAGEGRSITVTVKYGASVDDSQISFHGAAYEVYDDIATCFGLDRNSVTSLSLHELVAEVGQIAQSTRTVMKGLGGHIVPQGGGQAETPRDAITPGQGENAVLQQIAACETVDELRRLWAANQAAFSDPAVMDAWKARGRSLKRS
jgi:hypothetical protein